MRLELWENRLWTVLVEAGIMPFRKQKSWNERLDFSYAKSLRIKVFGGIVLIRFEGQNIAKWIENSADFREDVINSREILIIHPIQTNWYS